jgi:hypothetical protein
MSEGQGDRGVRSTLTPAKQVDSYNSLRYVSLLVHTSDLPQGGSPCLGITESQTKSYIHRNMVPLPVPGQRFFSSERSSCSGTTLILLVLTIGREQRRNPIALLPGRAADNTGYHYNLADDDQAASYKVLTETMNSNTYYKIYEIGSAVQNLM